MSINETNDHQPNTNEQATLCETVMPSAPGGQSSSEKLFKASGLWFRVL